MINLVNLKKFENLMSQKEIQSYLERLFPLNRSLTGNGNRASFNIVKEIIPLKIKEIPTNTKVYDWKIPKEWNIKDAYILDKNGKKLISFKDNNLHVMGYSQPINKILKWESLKKKLIYLKENKNAIPYRTSYYDKDWSFCVSKLQYEKIQKSQGPFKVLIDSQLTNGSLTYADYIVKGKSKKEILISTYICHPSMANDCLSGFLLTAFLAKEISKKKPKWTYRFVFIPETIGAIAYCKLNEKKIKNIDSGLVITTVGGKGKFGYKQSWNSGHQINKDIESIFKTEKIKYKTYPFSIRGSDERQYSSQAFKINTATITKDKYFEYKQYHNSFDNLSFTNGDNINQSLKLYLKLISKIEKWEIFENKMKTCEYMLSKRDLYSKVGGAYKNSKKNLTHSDMIQWILYLSNGKRTIEEISIKLKESQKKVKEISLFLTKEKLLNEL